MSRVCAALLAWAVLVAGLALPAEAAVANGSTRSDQSGFAWTAVPTPHGVEITVRSPNPIPPSDSVLTIRSADTILGSPESGADFKRHRLDAPTGTQANGLSLWLGDRRLSSDQLAPQIAGSTGIDTPLDSAEPRPRGDIRSYDPTRPGPFKSRRIDINLGLTLQMPQLPRPVEDVAEVTYPVAPTRSGARGAHPVVVLLHGRHSWCYSANEITTDWPCAPGSSQVPSYLGYRYMADRLATQGFVAMSISANGINAQDRPTPNLGSLARTLLINHHMRRLAAANSSSKTAYGAALRGRIDASKVLMMGHSRGGEGVVGAAQYARSHPVRWHVLGVVPFAPTDFGSMALGATPSATLLPACDGDVTNLMGQMLNDHALFDIGNKGVLRTSTWVPGGNHNYFNTQWTPGISAAPSTDDAAWYGDDLASGQCRRSLRLTPARERAVGLSYITNAAAAFLRLDRRSLPFLDGRRIGMPSAAHVAVRSTPTGGAAIELASASSRVKVTRGMHSSFCAINNTADVDTCLAPTLPVTFSQKPHWYGLRAFPEIISSRVRYLGWNQAGSQVLLRTGHPIDVTQFGTVGLRLISQPNSGSRWAVVVRDTSARQARVQLSSERIADLTTGIDTRKLWAQWASASVAALHKANPRLDLHRINAIGLGATSNSGQGWVFDAWARKNELGNPQQDRTPEAFTPATLKVTLASPGLVTVPVQVLLRRPARTAITMRVGVGTLTWADLETSTGGRVQLRIPRGRRSAVAQVPITLSRSRGDTGVGMIGIYSASGAETGCNWAASVTINVR